MIENQDTRMLLERAQAQLDKIGRETLLYKNYYDGKHRIPQVDATDEVAWRFFFQEQKENICPRIVDAVVEKMEVNSITTIDKTLAPYAEVAWDIWQENRMDLVYAQAMEILGIYGKVSFIVWAHDSKVRIYAHKPTEVYVEHSTEHPGLVLKAVQLLQNDDQDTVANVFYPGRIEQYMKKKSGNWEATGEPGINPFNEVPVKEISIGTSDLSDIIPIQDRLNKSLQNAATNGDANAQPLRVLFGHEPIKDPDNPGRFLNPFTGADKLSLAKQLVLARTDSRVEQFNPPDNSSFLNEQEACIYAACRVGSIPPFMVIGAGSSQVSGESLKTQLAPLISKSRKRQRVAGEVTGQMMVLAVKIQSYLLTGGVPDVDLVFEVQWVEPAPETQKEQLENALLLKSLGVPLAKVLVRVLGWDPEEADEVQEIADAAAAQAASMDALLFNAGEPAPEVTDGQVA